MKARTTMPKKNTQPTTEEILTAVTRLLSGMGVTNTPTNADSGAPAPRTEVFRGRGRALSPRDERLLAEVEVRGSGTVSELAKDLSLPIAEVTASLRVLAEGERLVLVHEPQPSPGRGLRMRAYDRRNVLLERAPAVGGARKTG
jgi:hypothetical protein